LGALGAQVERWGVAMVKLDFLYLAAHEGRRCDERVSGVAALRQGLRAFVDALGDDVYVLGCGVPLLPAVGICHGARVGHDLAMPRLLQATGHPLDAGWSGFAGVRAQARNVAARWAQHGRWFDADPDVVMAWGADGRDPAGYPTEVARMLVVLALVCGGPFLLADDLAGLTPDERAVLEEPGVLDLLGPGTFRPVDIFDVADDETIVQHAFSMGSGIPTTWVATRGAKTIRALFNWDDVDTEHPVPHDLAGCIELWTRATVGERITVPARAVRVLVA
jgi:alpha-galactosidase